MDSDKLGRMDLAGNWGCLTSCGQNGCKRGVFFLCKWVGVSCVYGLWV